MPAKISTLRILLCFLILRDVDAQIYQWSCSPLDTANNRYTLPDLGIGGSEDVADSNRFVSLNTAQAFIFPLPSILNCNGKVSAMQYCYRVNSLGAERLIFTLLILEQNGVTVTIEDIVSVRSTPSRDICTRVQTLEYCCDTLSLDVTDQFFLPAANFAFGIIPVSILTYNAAFGVNLVRHYRVTTAVIGTPGIGDTFTLGTPLVTDRSLGILQFFIRGPAPVTATTTATATTTERLIRTTTEQVVEITTTTGQRTTEPVTTTEQPIPETTTEQQTTEPATEQLVTATTEQLVMTTADSNEPATTTSDNSTTISSAPIGVIAGAVTAGVLLVLILTLLILLILRAKAKTSAPLTNAPTLRIPMETNAAYIPTLSHIPVEANAAYVPTTGIPVEANTAYVPTPSIPVEANAAYVPTPSIPVEANAAYVPTTSIPVDSEPLYATPR